MLDKKLLSERDICTKFITPALERAGWDQYPQLPVKVPSSADDSQNPGTLVVNGKARQAGLLPYQQPDVPIHTDREKVALLNWFFREASADGGATWIKPDRTRTPYHSTNKLDVAKSYRFWMYGLNLEGRSEVGLGENTLKICA